MKSSHVAVLLSGLVFPGAGHFYLKHYLRATVLLVISLGCVWNLVSQAMQEAVNVLEQIDLSSGLASQEQITSLVAQSLNQSNSAPATFASVVLVACWVISMVDAYRLAKKTQDKRGLDQ